MSGSDFAGRVDVDATLPAVLAGDVAVASGSVEPVKTVIENLRFASVWYPSGLLTVRKKWVECDLPANRKGFGKS